MSFPAEIAPVVDRLVLAVNTVSRAESKDRIAARCAQVGVDSPEFPGHYAEFLLAGRLTQDLAVSRLHYQPPERILGAVTGWERAGLSIRTGDRLAAGPELGELAEAILEERRVVATRMWSGHAGLVDTANRIISGMLALLPGALRAGGRTRGPSRPPRPVPASPPTAHHHEVRPVAVSRRGMALTGTAP